MKMILDKEDITPTALHDVIEYAKTHGKSFKISENVQGGMVIDFVSKPKTLAQVFKEEKENAND